jgi:hypothetical protein
VFDYHTVEDLHGMDAADILADPISRPDSKMRHFTGEFVLLLEREGTDGCEKSILGQLDEFGCYTC